MYAEREVCAGGIVHRNDDDTAQDTAEKYAHPLRGIRRPDDNAITLRNPVSLEFARETERSRSDVTVAPADDSIPAPFDVGTLRPQASKIIEVIEKRAALHSQIVTR